MTEEEADYYLSLIVDNMEIINKMAEAIADYIVKEIEMMEAIKEMNQC